MDKFGARVVIIFSSLLVAIGQIFFLLGVDIRLYYLALFGRGIYGCGGDNLDLGQSIIVIKWFSGKELSMAFGINSSMSLFGIALNDNIEPIIVESTGSLIFGLFIGAVFCFVSLLAVLFLVILDKKKR